MVPPKVYEPSEKKMESGGLRMNDPEMTRGEDTGMSNESTSMPLMRNTLTTVVVLASHVQVPEASRV